MPPDTPYRLPSNFLYLREATNELFVDSREWLPKDSVQRKLGAVTLMQATIRDEDEQLTTGYVADIRRAKVKRFGAAPSADMPSDQDWLADWEEDTKAAIPIAAIAYADDKAENGIAATGDPRFADAVIYLTSLVDQQAAEEKQAEASKKSNSKTSKKSNDKAEKSTKSESKQNLLKKFAIWLGF